MESTHKIVISGRMSEEAPLNVSLQDVEALLAQVQSQVVRAARAVGDDGGSGALRLDLVQITPLGVPGAKTFVWSNPPNIRPTRLAAFIRDFIYHHPTEILDTEVTFHAGQEVDFQ